MSHPQRHWPTALPTKPLTKPCRLTLCWAPAIPTCALCPRSLPPCLLTTTPLAPCVPFSFYVASSFSVPHPAPSIHSPQIDHTPRSNTHLRGPSRDQALYAHTPNPEATSCPVCLHPKVQHPLPPKKSRTSTPHQEPNPQEIQNQHPTPCAYTPWPAPSPCLHLAHAPPPSGLPGTVRRRWRRQCAQASR